MPDELLERLRRFQNDAFPLHRSHFRLLVDVSRVPMAARVERKMTRPAPMKVPPMPTRPLNLHRSPATGFDEPFEMLLACHERVQRMLALLLRLAEHLAAQGADNDARQAAHDVMRYFDQAGPAHHEDEERHLFPLLLAQGEPGVDVVVRRLQQDHLAMSGQWRDVRTDLLDIEAGRWRPGPRGRLAEAQPRWQAYADLYAAHIAAEEGQAYPAARPLLSAPALRAMGQEMAQRRGVPPPR